MGRIRKVAGPKHEATLSPALASFVSGSISLPLARLPSYLSNFPKRWPFPRGDLYHWIPLLNRFDQILESFIREYGLQTDPQTVPFSTLLLVKGVPSENNLEELEGGSSESVIQELGFGIEGDRELVESILSFSKLLLENCGNRSLYNSSERLSSILNTISLTLVSSTLRLSLRLAQRYYASRPRISNPQGLSQSHLALHYNIDLGNVEKLAAPFSKPVSSTGLSPVSTPTVTPSGKGKERYFLNTSSGVRPGAGSHANNFVSLARSYPDENSFTPSSAKEKPSVPLPGDEMSWEDWGSVRLLYYGKSQGGKEHVKKSEHSSGHGSHTPSSPSPPSRRASGLGANHTSRPSRLSHTDDPALHNTSSPTKLIEGSNEGLRTMEIPYTEISTTPLHQILGSKLAEVPEEYHYELLNRLRIAYGLSHSLSSRREILAIRILAVTNLAYIYPDNMFQQKVLQQEADEPRSLQFINQLAQLVQSAGKDNDGIPRELQTLALIALNALANHRTKSIDVCNALSINVSHGVLLYVTRKALADLGTDDEDLAADEWRDALFAILDTLPSIGNRTGDSLVQAGLIQVLVEMLKLRTPKAEQTHPKILSFFDNFVHSFRDAFSTLTNARGLDIMADLVAYEVQSAFERAKNGEGIHDEHRTRVLDYQIPFFQQQTLRSLFKFFHHLMQHSGGGFDRLIRNLIDSPQLLTALRTIFGHAHVFGSTVWSGAVNVLTAFIHNEPTSYAVIAEAGLSKVLLEAVTMSEITVPTKPENADTGDGMNDNTLDSTNEKSPQQKRGRLDILGAQNRAPAQGILPASDAISAVPEAFGAICLHSSGLELFNASNAFESFFEIFESPEHVKCMAAEAYLLPKLGSTFDELVRHHPELKAAVLSSLLIVAQRVGSLCSKRASDQGIGAQLYVDDQIDNKEPALRVAGGARALLGAADNFAKDDFNQASGYKYNEDVDMNEIETPSRQSLPTQLPSSEDVRVTADQLKANDKGVNGPVTVNNYLFVFLRFLVSLFDNQSTMCHSFVEAAGAEIILDYTTISSLQHDFNSHTAHTDLARVIHMLTEVKPHLVLPSILQRAQEAINQLDSFLAYESGSSFFDALINPHAKTDDPSLPVKEDLLRNGTAYVKSLVSIHTLTNILSEVFLLDPLPSRMSPNHNIFGQVNLTDMYTKLIKSLGKLRSTCFWEDILIQRSIPEQWQEHTGSRDRYTSPFQNLEQTLESLTRRTRNNDPNENAAKSAEPSKGNAGEEKLQPLPTESAKFKNTQILRLLLNKIPVSITSFFQGLGKALAPKRRETLLRQNAAVVAGALAQAAVDQLQAPAPAMAERVKDRYSFWIDTLNNVAKLLIDHSHSTPEPHPVCLTMILSAFKNAGGLNILNDILRSFRNEVVNPSNIGMETSGVPDDEGQLKLAYEGMEIISALYAKITPGKNISEAPQTGIMYWENRLDQVVPQQFIVDVRYAILPVVREMWESAPLLKADDNLIKSIIEILRAILEADEEMGARRRADSSSPKTNQTPKLFTFNDRLSQLTAKGFDDDLAREAMFRCNNNVGPAEEYCKAHHSCSRLPRLPIPESAVEQPELSRTTLDREDSQATIPEASESPRSENHVPTAESQVEIEEADNDQSSETPPPAPGIPSVGGEDLMSIDNVLNDFPIAAQQPSEQAQLTEEQSSKLTTIDDLEDERKVVRDSLIDNCLNVLENHSGITFELADLIRTAASKASDSKAFRGEVGTTLVQSLVSLQVEDDYQPETKDIKDWGTKAAAYANLIGLAIQEKAMYDAALDELKANFRSLLVFIRVFPEQPTEESSPWIGQVLLIMERLLSDDAQPRQIKWTPPSTENDCNQAPLAEAEPPVVPLDDKLELFKALIEVLPKVGKDQSLAESIIRTLVFLTRERQIGIKLGEKRNMQRLFLMMKQLSGASNQRILNSFMIVLRHVIEDEDTIKQIMKTEIVAYFMGRNRHIDITGYVRQMYHLVLRSPETFVEVTNDVLQLDRYDRGSRTHHLILKPAEKMVEDGTKSTPTAEQAEVVQGQNEEDKQSGNRPSPETDEAMLDKAKSHEMKAPIVEHPDGVIHYILCEILSYKDVEDAVPPSMKNLRKDHAEDQPEPGVSRDSSPSSPSQSPAVSSEEPKVQKQEFKAEEHPMYIYRCFLLQCLTELLSSYNRTKVEFINFSRKADPQAATPSKPRSGVLNYLLNAVIPTGTTSAETIPDQKKANTSSWAMKAVVALCTKTGEHGLGRAKDYADEEDEPDLTFVRKFVLEHALKAYKDASSSNESMDSKYARIMCLADLFDHMIHKRTNSGMIQEGNTQLTFSHKQVQKLMIEKNFISALTASIADIDLNFPGSKETVKHILRPLNILTRAAITLSETSSINTTPGQTDADEISSASSVSDRDDDREQTPDLFRNSTLGMLDLPRDEESSSGSSAEEDDDDMYDDEYGDEMDYDDDIPEDDDEVVSDEDEQVGPDGGPFEGLPGDVMDLEVVIDHGGDEDDDEDDDEGSDDEDDDMMDDEDLDAAEEIVGGDGGSLDGDDEDEWESEDDHADDYDGDPSDDDQLEEDDDPEGPLDDMLQVLEEPGSIFEHIESGAPIDRPPIEYMEDDMGENDDDDDDEEEDMDEDVALEPEWDEEDEFDALPPAPWNFDPNEPFIMPPRGLPHYRSHRSSTRHSDDGANPLLHRRDRTTGRPSGGISSLLREEGSRRLGYMLDPAEGFIVPPIDAPATIVSTLMSAVSRGTFPIRQQGGSFQVHLNVGPGGTLPRQIQAILGLQPPPQAEAPRYRDDPTHAVTFTPDNTTSRWQEEARIMFNPNYAEKCQRVINSILRLMVPPAMEEERIRKEKEAEEKKRREEEIAKKAEEERIAREKREQEERERKEREEREAVEKAAAQAEEEAARAREVGAASADAGTSGGPEAMEGVEPSTPQEVDASEGGDHIGPSEQEPARIHTIIRGRELDITGLEIDPEYLEALPEDLREEVLMHQLAERRSQEAASGEEPSEINREFLEALPADIREELLQQEAQDRRRRDREARNRDTNVNGSNAAARAEDMDTANFLASLDPQFRQVVLMEQSPEIIAQLPDHLRDEARALGADRRLNQYMENSSHRSRPRDQHHGEETDGKKPPRKQIIQMLDKAGVATLLRLMFMPLQGRSHDSQNSLNGILHNICQNRQNRDEVVSILLSILQDGSADIAAVERSFAHLSLRAKQTGPQKTPQPPRRSLSGHIPFTTNSEMSPLTVVHQCLGALNFLVSYNKHITSFFLTEHDQAFGPKSKSARKGKGKENKASKYALNTLLGLLDRKLIMESSSCMEQLSTLLQNITQPLVLLNDKDKTETKTQEPTQNHEAQSNLVPTESTNNQPPSMDDHRSLEDTAMTSSQPVDTSAAPRESQEGTSATVARSALDPQSEGSKQPEEVKPKKKVIPPVVPEQNLRLVVSILGARECNSKTFRDTLSTINNMSAIPGAKEIFGQELLSQARNLAASILADLEELLPQIKNAQTGMEVQGLALAKFSPASSDQAKLLRVLTALDYIFDPKRTSTEKKESIEEEPSQSKEAFLAALHENPTFGSLWAKLSDCLVAIRERENMLSVATILLPLVESLMVVCKNTTPVDTPAFRHLRASSISTPPPESRMESLFFSFTEEHRKILNDLVRNNPKLMSGTFSLLVRNPKVLEFDNKRNYFNRRMHSRNHDQVRHTQPPLQLSVRRDQVFLDSFKSLYFKSADEMKYGKLNIRFHGEEGVDAGGVTREWFQVLSRQMFNADYALFIPVASDRTTFHPNSLSSVNPEHLLFFKFIGRIIGKALYEGRVLDCHFSRAVYKRILGKTVSIKDMETLDLEYYKSLVWMLENDITDIITETFSIEENDFGATKIIDLIDNGRSIAVTEENKQEYVQLVVEYKLTGSVKQQLEEFLKGFHDIVPADLISIFNEQELELLISGLPDIDVDDWKNNTEYHNYSASSPQIQWFWRAVRSFDKEERAKLLQFVTGTSKVPLNGFKELEGMNGFSKFNIHRDYGSKDRLPSSHTCFNQLDLPEYDSYEALRQQMYTAMTTGSEYFGFA
ncbi:MAG: hypothetical protein M1834_002894 [Cirrosporium novae-zelandiae]|nr:MAG: hypothetical protein M1834_002894 [Cirrosporium novae-zelandiae]